MDITIKTEGKISLWEAYSMPYFVREQYKRLNNKYVDEKNGKKTAYSPPET